MPRLPGPAALGPLGRFFLQVFLWLPFCFLIWYNLAGMLSVPALWVTESALNLVHDGLVERVEGWGRAVHFVSSLEVPMEQDGRTGFGQLVASINPLAYTWNLPVLFALLFAAPNAHFAAWRLVLGWLALLPVHAWGIGFEVLKVLAVDSGSQASDQMGLQGWHLEVIGYGYQLGYLMLPVIGAATIWLMLNRGFVAELAGHEKPRSQTPEGASLTDKPGGRQVGGRG